VHVSDVKLHIWLENWVFLQGLARPVDAVLV
jgi:hypothetical protein